jgi:dihydrofolate synthase/folylpolyglutamate synthase
VTFEEAMHFLIKANQYGSVLGLENMQRLLNYLGNPQDKLKFIHIAGTNGKGSTTAFIANIMADSGYRVGRYISPSVFCYREIIQISYKKGHFNDENFITTEYISEKGIIDGVSIIKAACNSMVEEGYPHPTSFEIETAMAFLYFLEQNCDLVVLEVGLGGRLDATNIIKTTLCAVFTSISMDHMQILGDTLEKIAFEKAGIIKSGIQVISYDQTPEAEKVIETVCRLNHAELTKADFGQISITEQTIERTVFSYQDCKGLQIHLLGENQVKNAVLALLTVRALQKTGFTVTDKDIRNGLFHTSWRGRLEVIQSRPLFLIDGAHNEDAAKSLAKNIEIYFANKRIIYIIGVLADKDFSAVLEHTGIYAERIITVTPANSRALPSAKLAETARRYCNHVIDADKVTIAIETALQVAEEDDVIIAFGSLSYLNEVYAYFDCLC